MHPAVPKSGGIFECFAIEITDAKAKARVSKLLNEVLGPGCSLQRFGNRKNDYELAIGGRKLSPRKAWDAAYALRSMRGVSYAEPLFATSISDNPAWKKESQSTRTVRDGTEDPLRESEDPEWPLRTIRVKEAWQRFFPDPANPPGHGVRVGHPDTGYQDHPEVVTSILGNEGYDFLHDDPDAHDDLERPRDVLIPNPGHGTGTSSVIVSPGGRQHSYPGQGWVSGVAPGAKVVPLRAAHSVVLLSSVNLARAIEYAASHDVHVISISLGGLFSWRLRQAIAFAQERGVIICSAAGNYAPFVGWPAAYDEVIACTACNVRGEIWRWACRGRAVDVTAPGESVWRATVERRDGQLVYDVTRGSGSSFATTFAVGLAAMWLSYHGYDALVERYGKAQLPFVFNTLLRESCVNFPGFEEGQCGAGLVDAVRLLESPLPDVDSRGLAPPTAHLDARQEIDRGGLRTFAHLFSVGVSEERGHALVESLSALLGAPAVALDEALRETGQELAFLFATDPKAYFAFDSEVAMQVTVSSPPQLGVLRAYLIRRASRPLRQQLESAASAANVVTPTSPLEARPSNDRSSIKI